MRPDCKDYGLFRPYKMKHQAANPIHYSVNDHIEYTSQKLIIKSKLYACLICKTAQTQMNIKCCLEHRVVNSTGFEPVIKTENSKKI